MFEVVSDNFNHPFAVWPNSSPWKIHGLVPTHAAAAFNPVEVASQGTSIFLGCRIIQSECCAESFLNQRCPGLLLPFFRYFVRGSWRIPVFREIYQSKFFFHCLQLLVAMSLRADLSLEDVQLPTGFDVQASNRFFTPAWFLHSEV